MPTDINKFNKMKAEDSKNRIETLQQAVDIVEKDVEKSKNRKKGLLGWMIPNLIFLAILMPGIYFGSQTSWLYSIAIGAAWGISILSLVTLSDKLVVNLGEAFYKSGVPRWLDVSYDIGVTVLFAASGSIFTAFVYMTHIFLLDYGYKRYYELVTKPLADAKILIQELIVQEKER